MAENIYFIGLCREDGDGYQSVKVGRSKSPKARLREMQTGNPGTLEIIASFEVSDSASSERILHKILKDKRTNGEWFEACPEVFDVLYLIQHIWAKESKPAEKVVQIRPNTIKEVRLLGASPSIQDVSGWLVESVDGWNAGVIIKLLESMEFRIAQMEYGLQCFGVAERIAAGGRETRKVEAGLSDSDT